MEKKTQYDFQLQIQREANINVVTCGSCGDVFFHDFTADLDELICPYCGFTSDPCDFPDLHYTHEY